MTIDTLEAVLLVILGGLFGWSLGKLPERVIYGVFAAALVIFIIVVTRQQPTR